MLNPHAPKHPMTRPVLLAAFSLLLGTAACSKTFIPNTDVEDTSDNRRIVAFCEKYRRAVEDRDVDGLMAMVSPRYFETGGNARSSDDIDFNGLREYLASKFKQTKAIRYEIRYQKVIFTENNHVLVNYRYSASYRTGTTENERGEWHHTVADNQLDLVPDGDGYKILAGM